MLSFIDREALLQHNLETLNLILLNPGTPRDILIGLSAGFLALSVGLSKTHSVGSAQGGSLISGTFAAAIGVFGLVEIYAASELLMIPYFGWERYAYEITVGAVVAGFFLMVAPLTRVVFHSQYWTSVGAWLIGGICAGLFVYFTSLIYEGERPQPGKVIEDLQHKLDIN